MGSGIGCESGAMIRDSSELLEGKGRGESAELSCPFALRRCRSVAVVCLRERRNSSRAALLAIERSNDTHRPPGRKPQREPPPPTQGPYWWAPPSLCLSLSSSMKARLPMLLFFSCLGKFGVLMRPQNSHDRFLFHA